MSRPDLIDANGVPCSDLAPLCAGLTPPLMRLGGDLDRTGWYVQAVYSSFGPSLLGGTAIDYVVRVDDLGEDDNVRDLLDARRLALGLVFRPWDRFRLKFEYEITDEDANEFDNNAVLLEGSVDW